MLVLAAMTTVAIVAVVFLCWFLVALCKDTGRSQFVGYELRIEDDARFGRHLPQ